MTSLLPFTGPDRGAVSAARTRLVLSQTWFATLACRLNPVADATIERAIVDGRTLRYNAEWFEALTPAVQESVWCGAVMRCALLHMTRRNGRELRLWNEASAHVVNLTLREAGFRLPDGCNVDDRFAGMAVEQVFSILKAERVPPPAPLPMPAPPSSDDGDDDEDAEDDDEQHDEDADDYDDEDQDGDDDETSDDDDDVSDVDALGGVEDADEDQDADDQADDEDVDGGGSAGAGIGSEALDIETDWNVAVQQATFVAEKAKAQPEGVDRAAAAARRNTDWRPALARYFIAAADYSWTRPNRRFVHQGVYLPGSYPGQLRNVYIVVDCSGSINQPLLDMFGGELQSILDTAGWPERLTVLYHDDAVRKVEELHDVVSLSAQGGGGTSFRCVTDHIEASGEQPDAVVWFTDLMNGDSDPLPETPYPVLWAVPMRYAHMVAPFGERIVLEA